jgi:hypothetical protein
MPDLQRVSFYNIIDFLTASTTELISSLILIKELSELAGLTAVQGIVISLGGCCGVQISCKIATRIYTSDQSETILVGAKTTPQYLRCNFNYEALGIKANSSQEVLWCLMPVDASHPA